MSVVANSFFEAQKKSAGMSPRPLSALRSDGGTEDLFAEGVPVVFRGECEGEFPAFARGGYRSRAVPRGSKVFEFDYQPDRTRRERLRFVFDGDVRPVAAVRARDECHFGLLFAVFVAELYRVFLDGCAYGTLGVIEGVFEFLFALSGLLFAAVGEQYAAALAHGEKLEFALGLVTG